MKEAIHRAEDLGLVYHVEVVNRFEQFLVTTAEEAAAYVIEVGSPNQKILLDTYHMNIEEDMRRRGPGRRQGPAPVRRTFPRG